MGMFHKDKNQEIGSLGTFSPADNLQRFQKKRSESQPHEQDEQKTRKHGISRRDLLKGIFLAGGMLFFGKGLVERLSTPERDRVKHAFREILRHGDGNPLGDENPPTYEEAIRWQKVFTDLLHQFLSSDSLLGIAIKGGTDERGSAVYTTSPGIIIGKPSFPFSPEYAPEESQQIINGEGAIAPTYTVNFLGLDLARTPALAASQAYFDAATGPLFSPEIIDHLSLQALSELPVALPKGKNKDAFLGWYARKNADLESQSENVQREVKEVASMMDYLLQEFLQMQDLERIEGELDVMRKRLRDLRSQENGGDIFDSALAEKFTTGDIDIDVRQIIFHYALTQESHGFNISYELVDFMVASLARTRLGTPTQYAYSANFSVLSQIEDASLASPRLTPYIENTIQVQLNLRANLAQNDGLSGGSPRQNSGEIVLSFTNHGDAPGEVLVVSVEGKRIPLYFPDENTERMHMLKRNLLLHAYDLIVEDVTTPKSPNPRGRT